MQAWMVWDHTLCTVGEYHRRAIGVHRRGVVETAAIGVGIVESSCPVSRYRAGAGHQSHGAAGASGEGAGQIQQGNGGVDRETDQPGIVVPTIDDPGFLKDLRQTTMKSNSICSVMCCVLVMRRPSRAAWVS